MATPLYTFAAPTVAEIRDSMLRTIQNGLIAIGVSAPDVSENSDYWVVATAVANELAPIYANGVIASDATMPDTGTGADLDRWLNAFGLARRPAVGSAGLIRFSSSITTAPGVFVATGTQLLDISQLRYEVVIGGNYYDGQLIPVQSLDLGEGTDHENGETLTWVTGPPYSAKTVAIGTSGGTDGLSGGADAENDDQARARLFARLQNAPASGNSEHVAEMSEAATPQVEKGFVYPALQGPATLHFAVTARATTKNRSRQLDVTLFNSTVTPYVAGLMPEHVYIAGSISSNYTTNVALLVSLPSAPTASPPGPGGGWLDGTPWPSSISGTTPVTVSAVTDTTHITVTATTAPTDGVTHVSYLDPTTWTLYSAIVTSHGGTSGAYTLVLDTPFVNITTGAYLFPTAQNAAVHIAALLTAFAAMGPGEKSSNATVLQRAYRHPRPTLSWPYSLGKEQLKAVENSSDEVQDAQWIYRSTTTPPVADPPNILYPNFVGLYAA